MVHTNNFKNFSGRMPHNSWMGNYSTLSNEVAEAPQSLMSSKSSNSTQNSFSGGIGNDISDALYEELWHACVGPLVTLPRVGERAFYCPQDHIEQVEASTNQGIDQHMPLYDLPSKILCRVINVQFRAEL
jgi:hypothetical protein